MDYNRHFKRIRVAFEMSRDDVVACCRHGGLDITSSRAEGWQRSDSDTRRFVVMTDADFEAFTSGLVAWSREEI